MAATRAGGDTLDALDGSDNARASANGGGGGGGAGCVLIRNSGGTPVLGGVVNPTVTPGYKTLPILMD